jgi:hypothetical protein
MTALTDAVAAAPLRIRRLPTDRHGRPVPWFVHWQDDGVPDFRVIGLDKVSDALKFRLCWVCGRPRGAFQAFVIGPMCAVNRVSGEPPCHRDCAVFSAQACPFLTTPNMIRRGRGLEEHVTMPGHIARNPEAAVVWVTRSSRPFQNGPGLLFDLGEPTEVLWFAHGREAARAEVLASIESGLPLLQETAAAEGDAAVAALARQVDAAMTLVPALEGR